jgi:hypothetical protein
VLHACVGSQQEEVLLFCNDKFIFIQIFTSPSRPDQLRGPPSLFFQWIPEALFPGVKLSTHEANHLPPASAEVKNTWVHKTISIISGTGTAICTTVVAARCNSRL